MLDQHPQIIKGREVVNDDWSVLKLDEGQTADSVEIPAGKIIVPLAVWQAQRDALAGRAELGVWLAPDESAAALKDDLPEVSELDVEPVHVSADGSWVLSARAKVTPSEDRRGEWYVRRLSQPAGAGDTLSG